MTAMFEELITRMAVDPEFARTVQDNPDELTNRYGLSAAEATLVAGAKIDSGTAGPARLEERLSRSGGTFGGLIAAAMDAGHHDDQHAPAPEAHEAAQQQAAPVEHHSDVLQAKIDQVKHHEVASDGSGSADQLPAAKSLHTAASDGQAAQTAQSQPSMSQVASETQQTMAHMGPKHLAPAEAAAGTDGTGQTMQQAMAAAQQKHVVAAEQQVGPETTEMQMRMQMQMDQMSKDASALSNLLAKQSDAAAEIVQHMRGSDAGQPAAAAVGAGSTDAAAALAPLDTGQQAPAESAAAMADASAAGPRELTISGADGAPIQVKIVPNDNGDGYTQTQQTADGTVQQYTVSKGGLITTVTTAPGSTAPATALPAGDPPADAAAGTPAAAPTADAAAATPAGEPEVIVGADGSKTFASTNDAGQPVTMVYSPMDADGGHTETRTDAAGNSHLVSIDKWGVVTHETTDSADGVTHTSQETGAFSQWTTDAAGAKVAAQTVSPNGEISITDASGSTTHIAATTEAGQTQYVATVTNDGHTSDPIPVRTEETTSADGLTLTRQYIYPDGRVDTATFFAPSGNALSFDSTASHGPGADLAAPANSGVGTNPDGSTTSWTDDGAGNRTETTLDANGFGTRSYATADGTSHTVYLERQPDGSLTESAQMSKAMHDSIFTGAPFEEVGTFGPDGKQISASALDAPLPSVDGPHLRLDPSAPPPVAHALADLTAQTQADPPMHADGETNVLVNHGDVQVLHFPDGHVHVVLAYEGATGPAYEGDFASAQEAASTVIHTIDRPMSPTDGMGFTERGSTTFIYGDGHTTTTTYTVGPFWNQL